uniref:MIF4G domain-containing protein n=1 Tax=Anopheles funestus TaxID=62324 RepID=A0A4Y0BN84_ANOFN
MADSEDEDFSSDEEIAMTDDEGTNSDEEFAIESFVIAIQERYKRKAKERQQNQAPKRPSEKDFFRYDSSLKKTTAFVQRLKQFNAQKLPSLIQDVSKLNLTKYISKISAVLVEANLKMSDIGAVLTLCNHLHRHYADFAPTLFENWQKLLSIKPGEKVANPTKMRINLRFYTELISMGIIANKTGLPLLGACLTALVKDDMQKHVNLSIVLDFCTHYGDEYAGLVPKEKAYLAKKYGIAIPVSPLISLKKQLELRNLLCDYYQSLAERLRSDHKHLQLMKKSLRMMLGMRMDDEVNAKFHEYIEQQTFYNTLHASTNTLADQLGEVMPPLEVLEETGPSCEEFDEKLEFEYKDWWRFKDMESFYSPPYLCQSMRKLSCDTEEYEDAEDTGPGDRSYPGDAEATVDQKVADEETLKERVNLGSIRVGGGNGTPRNRGNQRSFEDIVHNLQKCVNLEVIEDAAIYFLQNLNTKSNRKRLVKVLFEVPHTRLDLLPLYARFVAIIDLVSPDVAHELCEMLKNDLKYRLKKKDQINIETKIKVVRYIGELVKFGIYKKPEALFCLRCLLHHNVEITCVFLEVCGVYLYNCPDSHMRTNAFLEQMMQLKLNTTMPDWCVQRLEYVYNVVKHPELLKDDPTERLRIHTFIHCLIADKLNITNVDKVLEVFIGLNWNDMVTYHYAVWCLSRAYNIQYHLIRCLADLLVGLNSYQERAVMHVIDTVVKDIWAGLRVRDNKLIQQRVAMVKYLGEMYKYQLVDSDKILTTLRLIISFRFSSRQNGSITGPSESLFRLQLACVLLDTCGQYFTTAKDRRQLDEFLIFFQRYYWYMKSHPYFTGSNSAGVGAANRDEKSVHGARLNGKNLFPIRSDQMYRECLRKLRPTLQLYISFEQAKDAVRSTYSKKDTVHNGQRPTARCLEVLFKSFSP